MRAVVSTRLNRARHLGDREGFCTFSLGTVRALKSASLLMIVSVLCRCEGERGDE